MFIRKPWIACVVLSAIAGISTGMTAAGQQSPPQEQRPPTTDLERQKQLEKLMQDRLKQLQDAQKQGAAAPAAAAPAPEQAAPPSPAVPTVVQRAPLASGQMQLAYEATDLYSFINQVADALGISPIVIDPDVKGTVTIHSNAPMSREEVFPLFNMILKNNNAALVKQGNIYQIVPTSSALKKGVEIIEHLPPPSQPKPGVEKPQDKRQDGAAPGVLAKPSAPAGAAPTAPASARPPAGEQSDGTTATPRLATHVIHVEFVPVRDLIEPLKLLMTEGGVIMPYERTNMLIVTDYSDSVDKILEIVHLLDNSYLDSSLIDVVKITYNKVSDVLEDLHKVFGSGDKNSATGINFTSLDRMNAILLMANSKRALDEAKTWIDRLDAPSGRSVQTFVYTVENSTASNIAMILTALFGGEGGAAGMSSSSRAGGTSSGAAGTAGAAGAGGAIGTPFGQSPAGGGSSFGGQMGSQGGLGGMGGGYGGGMGGGYGGGYGSYGTGQQLGPRLNQPMGVTSQFLTGGSFVGLQGLVRMVVDDINNSLIIQSSAADYQFLLETIKKMDVLPRQAVIDARIFEVDLTDALSFGISGALQAAASGKQLTTGALDAASGALTASTFAFVGNDREILLALNALRTKTKVRVLEAPSVLALDGSMARIVVGAEVPYPAGTFATGIGNVQTSVNYRDTGISLIVVPRISASGSVTLDVAQEVSAPGAVVANLGPSFSKTSVATTLSVKDGQTVAIAGLIRNANTVGRAGVPFLQDIPLLGHLFGQTTNNNTRTELLILLTPHVIRTPQRFQEMTEELKDSLRSVRKEVNRFNKTQVETLEEARKDRAKQEGKRPEENPKPEERKPVSPPEKPEQSKPEKPAPAPNPTPPPPPPVPPDSTSRPPDKPNTGGGWQ